MRKILFPTAYGEDSKIAYRYAQKLAQYFEASILLAHVYKNTSISINTLDIADKLASDQVQKLEDFAEEMNAKQFEDIPIDYVVSEGDVVKELNDIIKSEDIDLTVMGFHPPSIAQKWFGNITYDMVEQLDAPLLIVPLGIPFAKVKKIVYATAFRWGDGEVIENLFDWCQVFNASLNILHVHGDDTELELIAHQKMHRLKKVYKTENEANIISFQLSKGNLQTTIQQYVDEAKPNLLVLHKRKRGFWQRIREISLAKKMIEDVSIPLLVLKTREEKNLPKTLIKRIYQIEGLRTELVAIRIKTVLNAIPGIKEVDIELDTSKATISMTEEIDIGLMNNLLKSVGDYRLEDYFVIRGKFYYPNETNEEE